MQPIRIGVLGAAAIAQETLIPSMREAANATCVALASKRPGLAPRLAAKFQLPLAFSSYDELLACPDVDAVYIPLANGDHRYWTERAADAGKHVLCEKPMGVTLAEAERMFEAAERNGVRLLEAYSYYFHPQHQRVRQLLDENAIGAPHHLRCRLSVPFLSLPQGKRLDIRLDPAAGGAGILMDLGCYGIHTARRIFRADPTSVVAHSLRNAAAVDTTTVVILEFPGDRLAVIDLSFSAYWSLEYEVLGAHGSIRLPGAYGRHAPRVEYPLILSNFRGTRTEMCPATCDPATAMVEHFAELVRDPSLPAFTTKEETLAIMRVLDAAAASEKSGSRISLSLPKCRSGIATG